MGFNKENYAKIKQEYEGKYRRAEDEARLRRAEVHAAIPQVKEIDQKLSKTGFRIFDASLRGDQARLAQENQENVRLLEQRAALLKEAGYLPDYTEIHYECDLCGGLDCMLYCQSEKIPVQ